MCFSAMRTRSNMLAIGGHDGAKPDRNSRETAPRGPDAGQQAHDQPEAVPGDMDQVSLVEVLAAAQPSPAHAAAIEDQRKAALDQFGPQPERLPGHFGEQPGTIVVDGAASGIVVTATSEPPGIRVDGRFA